MLLLTKKIRTLSHFQAPDPPGGALLAPEASADTPETPRVAQKVKKFQKKIREGEKKGELFAAERETLRLTVADLLFRKIQNRPFSPVFDF